MFLSRIAILTALQVLEKIHPFWGTTFLACKKVALPIGETNNVAMSNEENTILGSYYDVFPTSAYYYQTSQVSSAKSNWVLKKKYATSTLQTMRTQTFIDVFLYTKGKQDWGWKTDYVQVLKHKFDLNLAPYKNKQVPLYYLAVWLYRENSWGKSTTSQNIVQKFLSDFNISQEEKTLLFDTDAPVSSETDWQEEPLTQQEFRQMISSLPPDIQDKDGILDTLMIHGVGPADQLSFDASERLNVITGDNGLGKSFLLEVAWWSLTETWAQSAPHPSNENSITDPKITFKVVGDIGLAQAVRANYDWTISSDDKWVLQTKRSTTSGLVLYAQIDGSIAIYDPLENNSRGAGLPSRTIVLSREHIWEGLSTQINGQTRSLINGIISDLVSWQRAKDKTRFDILAETLKRLSPPIDGDLGILAIDEPERIPNDARDIPTIRHMYGKIPITRTSAGVRRILSLAYILVWAWTEHLIKAHLSKQLPQKHLVILIDEIEAHLHPKWQRLILPALMQVSKDLAKTGDLKIQFIISTHSPLVLASIESVFEDKCDTLLHLDIDNGEDVVLEKMPYSKNGTVDYWLTSDVFELGEARAIEAENAIERAKNVMKMNPPTREAIHEATELLKQTLPDTDLFYPRWRLFASRHMVEI